MEHVSGGKTPDLNQPQITTMGPIYSDGMAGNEEEIEDAIAGGFSRYELGIEFGVPVDWDRRARDAANEVMEI
jgi:hypothetical protein